MVFEGRRDPSWSPGSASPKKQRPALVLRGVFYVRLRRRRSAFALFGFPSGARPLRGHPFGRAFALAALCADQRLAIECWDRLRSDRKAERPPAAGAACCASSEDAPAEAGAQSDHAFTTPLWSNSCWSSPASNISIMMSLPPTNSPFT